MKNQILDEFEGSNKGKKFQKISELRAFFSYVHQESQKQLDIGKKRAEIFEKFIEENGVRYQKHISRLVGFSITKSQEKEYENWIRGLIVFHIISIIAQLLIGKNYYDETQNVVGVLVSTGITILIDIYITRRLVKKWLQVLPLIVFIGVVKIFGVIWDMNEAWNESWVYGYIVVISISIVLSIIMKRNLFPQFGFWGPKKDDFGNYRF